MTVFKIELRAVRPVFCRGRDEAAAEPRPPSLKGLLRWWYRAWHPEAVASQANNPTSPWSEPRIMGGTGPGMGQSAFLLRIESDSLPKAQSWWRPSTTGYAYLGFPFHQRSQGEQKDHRFLPEGTTFTAVNVIRRDDEEVARGLIAAWWLFAHFGGLGARSRRGFGSLSIVGWSWPGREELLRSLPLAWEARDEKAWREAMIAGLSELLRWRGEVPWPRLHPHPHIGADAQLVLQSQPWANGQSAHEHAGVVLAGERRSLATHGALDGRVTIGLPFKDVRPASFRREPFGRNADLHASSLHLHVAAFAQGRRFGLSWLRLSGPVPGRGDYRLSRRGGAPATEEAPDALGALMANLADMRQTVGSWPR